MRVLLTLLLPALIWAGPYEEAEQAYKDKDFEGAIALYHRAIAAPDELKVSVEHAMARLGTAYRKRYRMDEAKLWLGKARAGHDPYAAAVATRNLGAVHQHLNELDEAVKYFEEARASHASRGETKDLILVELYLAGVTFKRGERQSAYDAYVRALEGSRSLDDIGREATALLGLGLILSEVGDGASADWFYGQAAEAYAALNRGAMLGEVETFRAHAALFRRRPEEALQHVDAGRPLLGDDTYMGCQLSMTEAYARLQQGMAREAMAALDRCPLRSDDKAAAGLASRIWLLRARALVEERQPASASAALETAKPDIVSRRQWEEWVYLKGRVAELEGRVAAARTAYLQAGLLMQRALAEFPASVISDLGPRQGRCTQG